MKNKKYRIFGMVTKVILSSLFILILFTGCASSCQRSLVDLKSDFGNGLERTINVYTANGEIIASYSGKIDIETNDGGYVKFDLDGKRYIYYNCFVETIADID